MTDFTCRACLHKEFSEKMLCKDFYSGNLEKYYEYAVCSNCKSLSIFTFYESVETIYNESYYILKSPNKINKFKGFLYKLLFNISYYLGLNLLTSREYVLYRELRKMRVPKDASILDIGCGNGNFLNKLKFLGYSNLSGIDPFFRDSEKIDKSLNITNKLIDDLDGMYDLIVAHHVIEHVRSPISFMSNIARSLSERGRAIVCFPTYGGITKEFKEHSYLIQAPQHACLISTNAFLKICKDAGLHVCNAIRSSESDLNWAIISNFWKDGIYVKSFDNVIDSKYLPYCHDLVNRWESTGEGSNLFFILSKS